MPPRVVFFAPPRVTALDLVGPLQVFQVAGYPFGHRYRIDVCALSESVSFVGDVCLSNLLPFDQVELEAGDTLFVLGCDDDFISPEFMRANPSLIAWIRKGWAAGATVCSICTGTYFLAEAGILDGVACATHWDYTGNLQARYPRIKVRDGVLFVEAGRVFSSAGIASGIDLAIHLVALRHGQKLAFDIARYMVVYLRRGGEFEQDSVYLRYRNHVDDLVHRAQSILIENLGNPPSLSRLAEKVGASPRNLSRRFRQSIDLSVGEYLGELRLERARSLLREEGSKVEDVARACGFNGSRQLRNLYQDRFGRSPRAEAPSFGA